MGSTCANCAWFSPVNARICRSSRISSTIHRLLFPLAYFIFYLGTILVNSLVRSLIGQERLVDAGALLLHARHVDRAWSVKAPFFEELVKILHPFVRGATNDIGFRQLGIVHTH